MPSTHYHTLGLEPSATAEQIRKAYRALAKTLHPDVNAAKDAAARFTRIAAAYEILSDPKRRREYDLSLAARRASVRERSASDLRQGHYVWVSVAGRPSDQTVDLSEVDDLFDTFFGGSGKARPREPVKKGAASKQEPNKPRPKKPSARRRPPG